jgi:hypothetical protein
MVKLPTFLVMVSPSGEVTSNDLVWAKNGRVNNKKIADNNSFLVISILILFLH